MKKKIYLSLLCKHYHREHIMRLKGRNLLIIDSKYNFKRFLLVTDKCIYYINSALEEKKEFLSYKDFLKFVNYSCFNGGEHFKLQIHDVKELVFNKLLKDLSIHYSKKIIEVHPESYSVIIRKKIVIAVSDADFYNLSDYPCILFTTNGKLYKRFKLEDLKTVLYYARTNNYK